MSEENKPEQPAPATPDAGQPQENAPASAPEEMQRLLEDARAKADKHWDQCVRLQAEMENMRRRAERDVEASHKFALERFAQELLPVRDSLELGLNAGTDNVEKLREGTELTLRMPTSAMEKYGVKLVDPVGQPFNPALHQAVSMQESADKAPNTVLMVMQKGYTLNDRLIRPAMVIVSRGPAGPGIDAKA